MERTLVLIKPDAVMRGLIGKIVTRFEEKGLTILAMKLIHADEDLAQEHYSVHQGAPFFDSLVKFISSAPIVAMVLAGDRAIENVRNIVGATDPKDAMPGSIRGTLALSKSRNCVHASDSVESAVREIPIFFEESEILSYTRPSSEWL